jgi:hypothetical protein
LLISCRLPGAYYATDILVWHDCNDEQDLSSFHAQVLNSLLAIIEPVVENLDLARIVLESPRGGGES